MSLTGGVRLGSYEIVAPIGAGGMGEVYRARDTKLNRDVAIKVLLPAVANDPDRLARFSREAQAVAALNHPNIVTIHGIERSDDTQFIVMELVEGQTLAEVIPTGGLALGRLLDIATTLADAVATAHERGIVHRDLKPANVFVGTEPGKGPRYDVQDTPQSRPRAISDVAAVFDRGSDTVGLSPDGTSVAARVDGGIQILPVDGGASRRLPGAAAGTTPLAWCRDGSLLFYKGSEIPAKVMRLNLKSGDMSGVKVEQHDACALE